jgi:hypothetical protein
VYFRKDISGNIWLTGNSFSSSLRNEVFTNGKLIGIDNNQNTVIDITSVIGSQNSSVNGFTIDNNNVKWFVAYGYNSVINPDSIKVDGNIYVMKLENDEWTKYVRGYRTGLINDYNSIAVDNINNALWFGDDYYGLYKFDGNDWTNYNTANSGLPVDYINDIAVDENGVKWVLAEGSLIISYNDAGWTVYDSTFTNLNLEFNKILGIDKFGNKWILSEYNGVVVFNENGVNLGTYTVSGNVSYDSDPSMIGWGNMTVNLYKEGNLTYTGVTDEDGNYNLNDVENGTYTIEYVNQRLWGGSDPLDALIVLKYYLRSYNFKYNLTFKAADVNNDKFVNPVDALYINRRYTGLINNFKIEDWLNNNSNYNIVIDGMDAQHSIMFISSGDLNGTNAYE